MTDNDSIADQTIDGKICAQCGGPLDCDAFGPTFCSGCAGIGDDHKQVKRERGQQADRDFDQARTEAAKHGFNLAKHTLVHFSITSPAGWRLELYPTKCRIFRDKNQPHSPFLKVPMGCWTLMDVVKAAIAATNSKEKP